MSETVRIADLVFAFDVYPRGEVDPERIERLRDVIAAGHELPPIIIDRKWRVVDGFHRARAYRLVRGSDAEIACEIRDYASDADLLLDAIRLNAGHGKPLSKSDEKRCLSLAERHGISVMQLASVFSVRAERISAARVSSLAEKPQSVRATTLARPARPREDRRSYITSFKAPVGLSEINALCAALRDGDRVNLGDHRIRHSLRNLAAAIAERLEVAA